MGIQLLLKRPFRFLLKKIKCYLGIEVESEIMIKSLRKNGAHIGNNVSIINSELDYGHAFLIDIGDNVTITGARVLAHDEMCIRDRYDSYPILVDENALKIRQLMELLDIVNQKHRKVISVKYGEKIHIKELIYISRNIWLPPNYFKGAVMRLSLIHISIKKVQLVRRYMNRVKICMKKD